MALSDNFENGTANKKNMSLKDIIDYGNGLGLDLTNPLLRKIFLLGYEVGYFRHNDYVDWVVELKSNLFSQCLDNGYDKQFEQYYESGKMIGMKEDDRVIQSLSSKFGADKQEPSHLVYIDGEGTVRENSTLLDEPDQIKPPSLTQKPSLIENPRQTEPPSIISMFGKNIRKKRKNT